MKDYEALFVSGVVVSSVIDWAPLSDNIVIGYAALFFQQIAKDKHDYDKEPLLVLKKHPKIDIIFIFSFISHNLYYFYYKIIEF